MKKIDLLDNIKKLDNNKSNTIAHEALWKEWETIHKYLSSFYIGEKTEWISNEIHRYVNDALPRFLHTIDFLPHTSNLKVLELGANPYLFTLFLKRTFNYDLYLANFFDKDIFSDKVQKGKQIVKSDEYGEEYEFEYDDFNIEQSIYPYPDESFDIVLFCEILEHIVVDPMGVFDKINRILKPGGLLLITTPNAVRLSNVAYLLSGSNFFDRYHIENGIYGRHNREFTVEEIENILGQKGFEVLSITTYDRYDYNAIPITTDNYEAQRVLPYTKDELLKKLQKVGAVTENRGDNIYALARKK